MLTIDVILATQILLVYQDDKLIKSYLVSTAQNGAGEKNGSYQTPRGKHKIRAKIGAEMPVDTVFVRRRPTGEVFSPSLREKFPRRDWILTRILWLCGLEPGKNRFGDVDTMRRFIYIHGAPNDVTLGCVGSRGCIRMHNTDLIELFNIIPTGTPVNIREFL